MVPATLRLLLPVCLACGCVPRSPAAAHGGVDGDRATFERARAAGGFTKDAYVVWSPIWPAANGEVSVYYDTRAPLAGLRDAALLTWFLTPEDAAPLSRHVEVGPEGIARVTERTRGLRPGWFVFGAGERRDNDCGNPWKLPIVPQSPDWHEATSAHFRYRWLTGDPVEGRAAAVLAALEDHLALIAKTTGLAAPGEPVVFLHYATRELGFTYQAHHGNNADEFRHLVFSAEDPDDAHELTHLLVNEQLGRHHEGLFDEGLATHLGQELSGHGWQGRACDDWAREGLDAGTLPPLPSIVAAGAFYQVPWNRSGGLLYYGAGCSFVAYLLREHGADKVRKLLEDITCATQDDAGALLAVFEADFGLSLAAADAAWRAGLQGRARGNPP